MLPIISFRLYAKHTHLNLEVLNTGKSPARNLTIQIIDISNLNPDQNHSPEEDCLSGVTFDLFPEEIVCNHIANIHHEVRSHLVKLKLSYVDDWDHPVTEERTVSIFNE